MATRGTYQVDKNQLLYNHWDNYPSGAASHFIDVIKKSHNLDFFSIIRGMDVKPASSKFDGPAEFYYEIDNKAKKITCFSISYDSATDTDSIHYHSSGSFIDWINDNIKKALEPSDNVDDFTIVEIRQNYFCTITQAKEEINNTYLRAKDMTNKGHTGNGSSSFGELFKMINKTGLNFKHIKDEYLRIYSPYFVKEYNHNDSKYFDNLTESI